MWPLLARRADNHFFGDDANPPSLLSLPLLGFVGGDEVMTSQRPPYSSPSHDSSMASPRLPYSSPHLHDIAFAAMAVSRRHQPAARPRPVAAPFLSTLWVVVVALTLAPTAQRNYRCTRLLGSCCWTTPPTPLSMARTHRQVRRPYVSRSGPRAACT